MKEMEEPKSLYKSPDYVAKLDLFNKMRLNNELCDVTIKVSGKELHAHKLILVASLNYFKFMLLNESFQESKQGVITMESIEAEDLEAFISYAYTGEILLTYSSALHLLEVANYLAEDNIKNACIEFITENLKLLDALQTYLVAKAIDIIPLKNLAKQLIFSDFEIWYESTEYCTIDYEILIDILSTEEIQPTHIQLKLLDGIVRWVLYDLNNRKVLLKDLLSSINIFSMTDGYLLNYLACMAYLQDRSGVVEEIMFYYYEKIIEKMKSEFSLVLMGQIGEKLCWQSYNFTEKKWSTLQALSSNGEIHSNAAVLNNKLYYISKNSQVCSLQVFNPLTKHSSRVHLNGILADAALCACSKFIYLCGGHGKDQSKSNHILRYDPQTNKMKRLSPMTTTKIDVAAIFYQGCLLVLGRRNVADLELGQQKSQVEKYDFDTDKWTSFPSLCNVYYSHTLAKLDGKLYACGRLCASKSTNCVEVYDRLTKSWREVACVNEQKSHFLLVALAGKLMAIRGSKDDNDTTAEVYDPIKDEWQIDSKMTSGLLIEYPTGGLVSSAQCNP